MAKVIAIANQKGGVGKTTTAVNLSTCLGLRKKKVLVIDSDPQSNTSSGLGIKADEDAYSTYDCIVNGIGIDEAAVKTEYDNLWVLPGSISLAGAEVELVDKERREFCLKDAIDKVRDNFDFIIIDCPPSLGLITLNSLCGADSIIIPIQCEYYALEGLSQLTKTIKTVKQTLSPNLSIEGILLTMFDKRTRLSGQVVEEVQKYFGALTFDTIIPRNVRLSEAPSYGQPITSFDKNSKGAKCYKKLALEIVKRNSK